LDEQTREDEFKVLLELLSGIEHLNLNRLRGTGPPAYPGKDPVEIVADYLTHVKGQLLEELSRQYPGNLLETLPVDLVITVPAVWSDKAKDRTFRAVAKAGFDETTFPCLRETIMVTEPEAAAIYVLKGVKEGKFSETINVGDCFVLCDAGGGTVDLISYRVRSIEPSFKIEEAAIGTGDKCGGSFVDRNFNKWLEKKLGKSLYERIADHPSSEKDQHTIEPKMGKLMQEFQMAKRTFTGEDDTEHYMNLPKPLNTHTDAAAGIDEGEIKMNR
jgi:molecular chaperone DnaK (HSP70)